MSTPVQDQTSLGHDGNVLAQILLEQGKQSTQLAVIVTKLDTSERDREATKADHESRIRVLERAWFKTAGAAAAIGAVAGYIAGHVHIG